MRRENVRKAFQGNVAVKGLDLEVPKGSVFGLLGPNGAGKTTLLRTLVGDLPPTSGRAQVTGALGFLPQDPRADRARAKDGAMTYVLSARGLDVQRERLETLRREDVVA